MGGWRFWSPSQIPSKQHPALGAGIPPENVTFHLVRAGGGFGRRLVSEYDIEVARIARLVTEERAAAGLPSVPVKLLWSREDDMAHDQYRPTGYHFFKAGLDASGKLIAYRDFVASTNSVVPANEFPRGFVENVLITSQNVAPFGIPVGALRAPPTNGVSFVKQGFIDEIAIAAGKDPLQYRIDLLNNPVGAGATGGFNPARARGVLEAVREMSAWDRRGSLPKGTGKGVAFQFAHAGYVAYVVEVSVDAKKAIKVNRAWCAVDIGRQIVNPSKSENLVHGGFIEGMSHLMSWAITIDKGRVVQRNFHQYQPTRMLHAPVSIEVRFLQTDFDPTGLGEPSLPPAVPGDHQRHLRGDWRSHPVVAVGQSRVPLDVDRRAGAAAGRQVASVHTPRTDRRGRFGVFCPTPHAHRETDGHRCRSGRRPDRPSRAVVAAGADARRVRLHGVGPGMARVRRHQPGGARVPPVGWQPGRPHLACRRSPW